MHAIYRSTLILFAVLSAHMLAAELVVDDFNDLATASNSRNLPIEGSAIGTEGASETFDGSRCRSITFNNGDWVAFWLMHAGNALDVSSFSHLHFVLRGAAGGEAFTVGIQQESARPLVWAAGPVVSTQWRTVAVPLSAFASLDKSKVQALRLHFTGSGTFHLDRVYFSNAAPPAEDPAYALSWSAPGIPLANINRFYWLTESNKTDIASALAATQAMPAGRRAIFSWDVHRSLWTHPLDYCIDPNTGGLTAVRGIWWENGAAEVTGEFNQFFQAYKAAGGLLDTFVLDDEHSDSNWTLGSATTRYDAIEADPRFPAVRAQLEAMGFPPGADLDTVRLWTSGDNYLIWNEVMDEDRREAYLRGAVFEPLQARYPSAHMSNYEQSAHGIAWPVRDANGHRIYQYGDGSRVGTHQSFAAYGSLGNIWLNALDGTNLYWRRSFNALRFNVNKVRSKRFASSAPMSPWVSHKTYVSSIFRDDDNYQELLYHTLLSGVDYLLLWNPNALSGQDPRYWRSDATDQLASRVMDEFTHFAGVDARQPLAQNLAGWGDDYLLTGMRAGGRNVWRFTPDVENSNLIAWVKFDGQDFDNDSAYYDGYTKLGTVNFTAGRAGAGDAVQFTGGTSGLQLRASDETVRGDTRFTIGCWFKTTQTYTTADPKIGGRLITLHRSGSASDKVSLGFHGNGTDTLMVTYYNGAHNVLLHPGSQFNNGLWHHIAATYETSTDQLVLYYDGAQVASAVVGQISNSGTNRVTIGTFDSATSSGAYVGALDEVAILTRTALNASQISALMTSGPELSRGYSTASTLVRNADPVIFTTAQASIVIPGGKVVQPPLSNSGAGFWIVQPMDAPAPRIMAPGPVGAPNANFSATPLSGNGPRVVAFSDLSSGLVTSYQWDFGDGASSAEPNPKHTYTAAGNYTVTLTVSGPGGSGSETKTSYIAVSAVPQPVEAPARLTIESPAPGTIALSFSAAPSVSDYIYFSDDLLDWQPLPGGPHDFGFLIQPMPGVPKRFFRLQR